MSHSLSENNRKKSISDTVFFSDTKGSSHVLKNGVVYFAQIPHTVYFRVPLSDDYCRLNAGSFDCIISLFIYLFITKSYTEYNTNSENEK